MDVWALKFHISITDIGCLRYYWNLNDGGVPPHAASFEARARAQPPRMPSVSEISLSSSHCWNWTRTPGPPPTPVPSVLPGHLLSR